ncbi:MAG: FtsX-like permease family protein [Bacteroidota bacterium]|jgi:putative ABC transport system permease protein
MELKLAWRNIFRNKRRSIITISSIIFAVVFSVTMRSLQHGAYHNMLKNIVGNYLGYIQIHYKGFWEEKTIDNSFYIEDLDSLKANPTIAYINHRIEGFALASHEKESKPVVILGINPSKESEHNQIKNSLIGGSFLSNNNNGLLIGKGLQKIMNINIGDSLIFLSQGFQGSIASGIYPVLGIVDLKTPDLNRRTVIMNLGNAQDFFGIDNMATSAVIGPKNDEWEKAEKSILTQLDSSQFEIMNWQQMLPELKQLIDVDRAGGTFVLIILYSILTFSLFGTVLMLAEERNFEFGVLVAIGMRKSIITRIALYETLIMSVVGVILGLICVIPVVTYFHFYPINLSGQMQEVVEQFGFEAIIPTSLNPWISITQALIVFSITIFVNLYTLIKIKNIQPTKAMRS